MPILLHDECVSLIPCMRNDIRLEVYPDSETEASGSLYLDDGASFEFSDRDTKSARLTYKYADNEVTVSFEHGAQYADIPNVASVVIYGVAGAPQSATTTDGSTKLSFVQNASTDSVYVILPAGTKASDVSVKLVF